MSRLGKKIDQGNDLLTSPRVTEKGNLLLQNKQPVYVFAVAAKATKKTIAAAVLKRFKVKPAKVAIVNLRTVKKAYVYLPQGTKLDVGN